MRGLKLARAQEFFRNAVASFTDAWIETLRYLACGEYGSVASFTDAWIETISFFNLNFAGKSHLLQMRGLKLEAFITLDGSPCVASFTDAWIETMNTEKVKPWDSRIFYRCVD